MKSVYAGLALSLFWAGAVAAQDQADSWRKYTNERFGFSLLLPSRVFVVEKQSEECQSVANVSGSPAVRRVAHVVPAEKHAMLDAIDRTSFRAIIWRFAITVRWGFSSVGCAITAFHGSGACANVFKWSFCSFRCGDMGLTAASSPRNCPRLGSII